MRKAIPAALCALILVLLALSGCGRGEAAERVIGYAQSPQPVSLLPTPEPSPAPTPEPTPSDVTITISAVGDVTLGTNHAQRRTGSFDERYEQEGEEYFLSGVADIFGADDLTIVNLEGPLTTSEDIQRKNWNHRGDPKYVGILTAGSVECVTLGNNHRLDYGESGLEETLSVLDGADIDYAYDDVTCLVEIKGVKIGVVSANEVYDGKAVETYLENGIASLRGEGAQLVVACCHWGIMNTTSLTRYQRELGKKCVDWGADLVIGCHPHVLQGVERYEGKYIVYSLGNFCYGGNENPAEKDTGVFTQTFTFSGGELTGDSPARFIPCSFRDAATGRNSYRPEILEGGDALKLLEKMNGLSSSLGVSFAEDGALS